MGNRSLTPHDNDGSGNAAEGGGRREGLIQNHQPCNIMWNETTDGHRLSGSSSSVQLAILQSEAGGNDCVQLDSIYIREFLGEDETR